MKLLNLSVSSLIFIALVFVNLSCEKSTDPNGSNNPEDDIAAVEKVLRDYEASAKAGDFEGWIALWADDGIQMPTGFPPRVGVDEITINMEPLFVGFTTDIEITSIEEVIIFGSTGLTRCSYHISITPLGGGDVIVIEPDGKALTIYQKQADGSWKIIYDCFNSNLPPAQ